MKSLEVIGRKRASPETEMTRLWFAMILVLIPETMSLNNDSNVNELAGLLPQPIDSLDITILAQWKTRMDQIAVDVEQILSEAAKTYLNDESHDPKIINKIQEVSETLNDMISVQSYLFAKKHEFKSRVIQYYALILNLISTHQTFILDKVPPFEELPDADGSTLIDYFPKVFNKFKDITHRLFEMRRERLVWPEFELYTHCQGVVKEMEDYIDKLASATAIDTFFYFNPNKKKDVEKWGKKMPTFYLSCMILVRYYRNTDRFEFSEIRMETARSDIHRQLENPKENNFKFIVHVLIAIPMTCLFIGLNVYRMFY